jgi:hypothetical protein
MTDAGESSATPVRCWCGDLDTEDHRDLPAVTVNIWLDDLIPPNDEIGTETIALDIKHEPGAMRGVGQARDMLATGFRLGKYAAGKADAKTIAPLSSSQMDMSQFLFMSIPIDDELDSTNDFMVGVQGGRTTILSPPRVPMTKREALSLAAWLAMCADPGLDDFAIMLRKVMST